MKKENRTHILSRYGIIVGLLILFSSAIVYKMVNTTVVAAPHWNALAERELSKTVRVLPTRGDILACDGSILATNLRYYTARIDFRCEKFCEDSLRRNLDALCDSLAANFGPAKADTWRSRILAELDKPKAERSRYFRLLHNISFMDCEQLKTFPFFRIGNPNKTGLTLESKMRRVNPYGDMARRSIGGVGQTDSCNEVHGISGLERALDSLLYGVPGIARKVPLTRSIVNWTDTAARPGYTIKTTIDIKMQDIVENELNDMLNYVDADWGVAVLMEVATGDIKAISNLEKNPKGPGYIEGMNRAVLGYEPGSVIKTLSMMIAVEDGIVDNLDRVITTGRLWAYAGGKAITDAHGVGSLRVREVIEMSSNIGMAKIITSRYDAHPGQFYSRVKQLGFLEPLHTGIAGERAPRYDSIPDNRGGRIALSRMAYGYTTEIPPLSMLAIYNAIANDGRYVRPRLVKELITETTDSVMPVTYVRDRACSSRTAAIMRDMLKSVVWGDHGTGRRLRDSRVAVAGKTGTCYIIENGRYNTLIKRLAFCGFFPADNPKYSCVVLTCHPRRNAQGAASTSGEVLKNIALRLYSRGMLDNASDFADMRVADARPTFYAGDLQRRSNALATLTGAMYQPKALASSGRVRTAGTVPDVTGYGLRQAVAELEAAGYDVRFDGRGYVMRQTPAAGSEQPEGTCVTLTLHE